MCAGGFEDEGELFAEAGGSSVLMLLLSWRDGVDVRAGAEEEDHAGGRISRRDVDDGLLPEVKALHECMGEADFGSVDGSIAGCFDEGKVVCIFGIEDDLVDGILLSVRTGESF